MTTDSQLRRRKILVSVYACEPDKGSEPGIGWNWVKQIARFHEVWVITRANNREVIERVLEKVSMPNVHWVYFDLPRWMRFWKKGQRGVHLYYYLWQIGIYFTGKQLHKEVGFDLVHHVTFAKYWNPSFLSLLPVPFIWGPVGGGEDSPKVFYKIFSFRGKVYERLRNLARWFGEHDPFVRLTARHARLVLAMTSETEERLRRLGCEHVKILSQIAMANNEIMSLSDTPLRNANPFRLVSIGRLLHWKGFHLGLMAFARFQKEFPNSEYWLIGDGPERKRLERLAQDLGIAQKVTFWGYLPRSQVLEKRAECNVFVHPSLHDSGGWVCLEAMAAGRPVICLNLGGPALQVTEGTGFKIPTISPDQVIRNMTQAMRQLGQNNQLRDRLGKFGRKRVLKRFNWDRKGEFIIRQYRRVCHQRCKGDPLSFR